MPVVRLGILHDDPSIGVMLDKAGLNCGVPDFLTETVIVAPFGTGPLIFKDPEITFCVIGAVAFEFITSISFCAGAAVEREGDVPIVVAPDKSSACNSYVTPG